MRLQTFVRRLTLAFPRHSSRRLFPPLPPVKGAAIRGNLHGGRQPIARSHVYLFAAATRGQLFRINAARPLLKF